MAWRSWSRSSRKPFLQTRQKSFSKSSRLEFSHPSGRTGFRRPLAGNAHRTPSCRRSSSCPAGGPTGVWGGSEKKKNNLLFLHFSYIFVSKQVRRQAGLQLRRLLTNQQVWHQLGNLRAEVAGHVYIISQIYCIYVYTSKRQKII